MIVKIGGDEFELEGVTFGQTPACRLRRRGGPMLTTEDFAAMPAHHRMALMALIEGEIAEADPRR
ncbi:MAG: hypothetical protein AB7O98_19715 [Hyphomonadaceae bacterium]